nr:pyrimidine 5'-nucleotidase [Phenylobacterium sp. J426]
MAAIVDRMTDYVQKVTGLPRDEAYALQKTYLTEHGLTLKGMMIHHGVDPLEFHAIFHDLSLEALVHDPEMLAALERLPGRRLIFTNADDVHAERVLTRLGLGHLFDDVFHIGSAGYWPKPSPEAFARIGAAHAVDPAVTAFFEDSERNLAPAHDLGMTTVLVGPWAAQSHAPLCPPPHRQARAVPAGRAPT